MALLTLALLLDLLVGDPDWLWRRVPHPVVWFGKVIDWADKLRERKQALGGSESGNIKTVQEALFQGGVLLVVLLLLLSIITSQIIGLLGPIGWIAELFIVAVLIAQKSLYDHVERVAVALRGGGIADGRKAVSMIVGRDVSKLDESGVSRAAIESLAENFSDGVVAPALWYAIAGLPGILFYKAVNTADSMIGHRNERYEHFGKAAAKVDDYMNWPAARLASLLVIAATFAGKGGDAAKRVWPRTKRDAPRHRSPNAGWPETSFAVALNLALGGPRRYGDETINATTLNPDGRSEASIDDIREGLQLFKRSCFALIALSGLVWFLFG